MAYRPGIEESKTLRMNRAALRAQRVWFDIERIVTAWRASGEEGQFPPIPFIVSSLDAKGWKLPRGGKISYRYVIGVIDRHDSEWWEFASAGEQRVANTLGMRQLNRFVLKEAYEGFSKGDQGMCLAPRRGGKMFVGMGVIPEGTYREFPISSVMIEVID